MNKFLLFANTMTWFEKTHILNEGLDLFLKLVCNLHTHGRLINANFKDIHLIRDNMTRVTQTVMQINLASI